MKTATYETFDAITRVNLAIFLQRVFAELNPTTEYLDNFHIHVLIDQLEELRFGRQRRLAVAMPPRSLKSLLISVAYVAWLLGHDPSLRIICASYGQELADKLACDFRQVIQAHWYKRMFPRTQLVHGRQSLGNFETTAGGGRMSTSVGGVLTGFGADFIVVDDPSKPSESLSDAERITINDWIQHTLFTRLNDKRHGRILIVMQRLHENDVIGNIIEKTQGDFKVLAFAAIAQTDEIHTHKTAFGVARVVRMAGEALHPAREPLEVLEEQRRLLGSRYFSAQYLQEPVPLEGGMVRRAWLRTYQPFEIMTPDRVVQSWDTAAKIGELNDYSVCTTWAIIGRRLYLLDVVRERLELPALKRRVIEEADRWRAERVLIEDKGSGTGLLQELRVSGFSKARPYMPKGDKVLRLAGVTPIIEEGRVYLPVNASWLDPYVHELCGFPGLKHDDQVDSTSQFFAWYREEGDAGGFWNYMQQEAERKRAFEQDRTIQFRAPANVSHFSTLSGEVLAVGPDGTIWVTAADDCSALRGGFVRLSP